MTIDRSSMSDGVALLFPDGELRTRLLAEPAILPLSPGRSDYDLNPDFAPAGPRELAPAAGACSHHKAGGSDGALHPAYPSISRAMLGR